MVTLTACSNGPAPRLAAAPFVEANYCPDDATLQTMRATQVGGGAMWVGDIGVSIPADGIGLDIPVHGYSPASGGEVKLPVAVRDGVSFESITMDAIELSSGEHASFEYSARGFTLGPATYVRPQPFRPFYGALRVPRLGVYRFTYALDGVEQGLVDLALCKPSHTFS